MRKDKMNHLRQFASMDTLKEMKQSTLTKLDSYMHERERCEAVNYQYKNQGLNTRINMNLKTVACLDILIEERRYKPILKSLNRGTKQAVLDLTIPDGWHSLSKRKNSHIGINL